MTELTERPQSLPTETPRIRTGCGEHMYAIISQDKECFELQVTVGKSGCCQQAMIEAIWRLIVAMRRKRDPIAKKIIIKCLSGIKCGADSDFLPSCPEALARLLKEEWKLKGEELTTK